jgi:hypothetical protein
VSPEERTKRDEQDFRDVMATEGGRRFVLRLIEETCRLHSLSFQDSPRATDFSEGQRSVGAFLLTEAQRLALEHYMLGLNERFRERQAEAALALAGKTAHP